MSYTWFRDNDGWQELKQGRYYPEFSRPDRVIQIYRREEDLYFGSSRVVKVCSGHSLEKYVLKIPSVPDSVETNKNEASILKALNAKEKEEGRTYLIQLLALFTLRGGDPVMLFPFHSFSLKSYIEKFPKGLLIQSTFAITKQMLKIADFLDRNKVVHRDIKPGNFLIDTKGKVKLCDFGLAFFKKDREKAADLEGSVHYMPPELFSWDGEGCPPYDTSSDMWGFGVTLYRAVSGIYLFRTVSGNMAAAEVMWQQEALAINNEEDPFKQRMEDLALSKLPEDAGNTIAILKGMLQFDPKNRWSPKVGLEFIRDRESPQVIDEKDLDNEARIK